jgi:uncharacterized protein (DUF736 family)
MRISDHDRSECAPTPSFSKPPKADENAPGFRTTGKPEFEPGVAWDEIFENDNCYISCQFGSPSARARSQSCAFIGESIPDSKKSSTNLHILMNW